LVEASVPYFGTDLLALLPTDDKYAALACLGRSADDRVPFYTRWLKELEREQPFELADRGPVTLKLRFPGGVRDPEKLARRVYRLGRRGQHRLHGVGVLVEGRLTEVNGAKALAKALRQDRPTLRLWWD
jgi:hypothetical protein